MKPDSIVKCVKLLVPNGSPWFRVLDTPRMDVQYTIREICDEGTTVRLEEIVIGWNLLSGEELVAPIHAFRELEFPDDLTEEINEALDAPIPVKEPAHVRFVNRF